MKKSDSIKNLAAALCKFQQEVTNPKNTADNPFFNSKYAPLDEVINTVKPLLAKHGLSYLQVPSGDGVNITITTLLMHESGEWIESDPLTLKAEKATPQSAGSAITYGRRYSLSAVLGITSEEDDDGNSSSGNHDKRTTAKRNASNTTKKGTSYKCDDCGTDVTNAIVTFCKNNAQKFQNKILCPTCQKNYK